MTNGNPTPGEQPPEPSAAPADLPDTPPSPSLPPAAPAAPHQPSAAWRNPWLIVVLIALGLAGWQWAETRLKLSTTQQEFARRLAESDAAGAESRALAKQAQAQLATVQEKLGALEAKIDESRSQQATLEALYQDLARNRDEWALAEVEQSVTLAAQQLQLAANVPGAVLALQTADTRLAGSSRPQFINLRKLLNHDLDRLRALPLLDLPGMNLRLEGVLAAVDSLPLAIDARPRTEAKVNSATAPAPVGRLDFWQRLGADFWGELRGLVRVQRFDRDEPALLAPGQSFFLRENLKLRLLNARLALLAHDQATFRAELKQAQAWVERYFDARDKAVQATQGGLQQLAATQISRELPTLNDSLLAIKNFKLGKERK